MCVSNPNNTGWGGSNLVLRACNQQMWQAFLALPDKSPSGWRGVAGTSVCR